MPPDDFGEKTEAPTPRKKKEARDRGQVAKSTDLTAAGALLFAMIILNLFAPSMFNNLLNFTQKMLGYSAKDAMTVNSMQNLGSYAIHTLGYTIAPICLLFMFSAVLITLAQVGLIFTAHPLKPDLQKIDPISGFSKIFSMQSLFKLLISLLKVGLIAGVSFLTIRSRIPQIVSLTGEDHWQILAVAGEMIYLLGIRLAAVLLFIAIFDYAYSRYKHEEGLKMSKQELKEEMRRMEGDPLVRERRRRVAQQLAMQRMQAAVPTSDVIVTNPTEFAIAIKYDSETMVAPKVVAKGADLVAKRIRQIAIENGIPIVERKPLARALYKTVEVGDEVPPSFYKAIAEILAYVYEISGKATKFRAKSA